MQKFRRVFEGIPKAGQSTDLNDFYTELFITERVSGEVNKEHEVSLIETASRKPAKEETPIKLEDIFKPLPGQDQPSRTIMTTGVAGIGKTILTHKFTLDWAEGKANQDIHFTLPFTFRELNLLKEKEFSLMELLHHIFIQTKGILRYDLFQVVFILDGLDECRLPLNFQNNPIWTDITKSTSVDVLLTNLIRGDLLPSARIWITTRPAAANQIPAKCVGMVTEVRGFTDPQKDEYFRKRFREKTLAIKIISHIKTSRSLHIMCHIPGMRVLVDARDKLGIGWQCGENEKQGMLVMSWEGRGGAPGVDPGEFQLYVVALGALWADAGIQGAYSRRAEFQLSESVKYFLDNLDRIGQLNYIPSKQDILFARKATKGIVEHDFVIKKIPFKMVDVGGQRSQRQKWFQCFDGITSILFMVSSSEYDQESMNIFETIVNNKLFLDVSIILFLNKTDLLVDKIHTADIGKTFSEFRGDHRRLEDVQTFLVQSFSRKRRNRGRPLFHHFTTAVDTENIRFVFHAVKDTILQENLKDIMLQ
ncbi:hypothetical protein NHX12_015552 [Muraenolepis orangiensis]|uniref:NACHT domain-containing protein n=1 Tax=Muraenolepis orangiensis TaxID=630683 RepID=A0A9Q0D7Y7_9TELE|nr:hypothetical protein NHX12_015552 [Muraenolepis orangiensis]